MRIYISHFILQLIIAKLEKRNSEFNRDAGDVTEREVN